MTKSTYLHAYLKYLDNSNYRFNPNVMHRYLHANLPSQYIYIYIQIILIKLVNTTSLFPSTYTYYRYRAPNSRQTHHNNTEIKIEF